MFQRKFAEKFIRIYDISRPLSKGEPLYPGNEPVILRRDKIFKKDGSNSSSLSFGLHNGSHLDAPFHYLKNGLLVDRIQLGKCLGWCRVVDFTKIKSEISEREIRKIRPKTGEIILLKTKNSLNKSRRFNPKFIHINEAAAKVLIKSKIKAVGIDGPSIRKFRLRPDTVHPLLLKGGILIYEGLNFKKVKPGRYFFIGLPLKIKGAEASPVRAVLLK